ncbi:MAG: class I SAM-dependent methyltransferase [bacterium]|nr:class I SAM-dependent methyltransferase [bacterium]
MQNDEQKLREYYEKNGEKNYYDDIYLRKQERTMRPRFAYKKLFNLIEPVGQNKKLLDVACGTGYFLQVAAERGLETYGLDLSQEAVAVAKRVSPGSNIVTGYAEALPYESSFFDYVSCLGSLEHFADMEKGTQEMIRVAKSDALFLFILPNDDYLFWKLKKIKKGTHQRNFEVLKNYPGWLKFLDEAGLEPIKVDQDRWPSQSLRIFEYKNPYRIARRIIFKLIWFFLPLKYTYQFIFVLKKKQLKYI